MPAKISDGYFGLDPHLIKKIDWNCSINRVAHDMRSDFIWAPHLQFILRHASSDLIDSIKSDLSSGVFSPGLPITIEVPKTFRIKVASVTKRMGPSFSRPGSILSLKDRVFYQALADQAASLIEDKTDHERSFSHRLAGSDSDSMFLPTRFCWGNLQSSLKAHAENKKFNYVIKLDVFDYFGSINQHTLINTLKGNGLEAGIADRLEKLLLSYTGQRSSRGILQGIYPSDLFGAFYMHPIDRFFDDMDIASARYVDDMYIFVENIDAADRILKLLIPELRSYDLSLNEVKSSILPKSNLFTEEPDLEALFAAAVEEISTQLEEGGDEEGYGFQNDWDDETDNEPDNSATPNLELEATKALFDSIDDFSGHEESIERFCLPLFSKADSDYALNHVIDSLKKRPSMTQIYASYLGKFVDTPNVHKSMTDLLQEPALFDWQKMWLIAALSQVQLAPDSSVKIMMGILMDGTRHDALRGAAAIYVGRFGDPARRKALFSVYGNVTEYIQLAIFYSSRSWPAIERKNARSAWGAHSLMHKLMSKSLG